MSTRSKSKANNGKRSKPANKAGGKAVSQSVYYIPYR